MIPDPPAVPDRPFPPPPDVLPSRPDRATGGGPKVLPAVDWSILEALLMGFVTNIVLAQVVVGVIAFSVLGVTSSEDPSAVYVGVISDLAWFGFLVLWLQQRHPGVVVRVVADQVSVGGDACRGRGIGLGPPSLDEERRADLLGREKGDELLGHARPGRPVRMLGVEGERDPEWHPATSPRR